VACTTAGDNMMKQQPLTGCNSSGGNNWRSY